MRGVTRGIFSRPAPPVLPVLHLTNLGRYKIQPLGRWNSDSHKAYIFIKKREWGGGD